MKRKLRGPALPRPALKKGAAPPPSVASRALGLVYFSSGTLIPPLASRASAGSRDGCWGSCPSKDWGTGLLEMTVFWDCGLEKFSIPLKPPVALKSLLSWRKNLTFAKIG